MSAPSSLGFTIEHRGGIDVVVLANDSYRPAMETEVAMWNLLANAGRPITHVVVADTDEFGTVACGYSGTPNDITRAVMAKACGQGYTGTFEARMDELGWRVEPVYLAAPVAAAPTTDEIYADTDALIVHLSELVDDGGMGGEPWPPAQAAIAGIRACQSSTPAAPRIDLPVWISVNDRLPTESDYEEEQSDVLVLYRYNPPNSVPGEWDVGESFHDADDMEWNGGWQFGSCDHVEVSHWMPKRALLALIDASPKGDSDAPTPDHIDADNGLRSYPWTYQNQPGNLGASALGDCARLARPGGDSIDHGLSLLRELHVRGFGIVRVAKLATSAEVKP